MGGECHQTPFYAKMRDERGMSIIEVMIASAIMGVVILGMASFFSYFNRQLTVQRKITSAQSLRMMMNFYIFSSKAVSNSANLATVTDRSTAAAHIPEILSAPQGQTAPFIANQMLQQCINAGGNDCVACGTTISGTLTPDASCNADGSNRIQYSISLSPSGRTADVVGQGIPLPTDAATRQKTATKPGDSGYTYPMFYNSFGVPCGNTQTAYNSPDCDIEVRTWYQANCPSDAARCDRAETIEVRYSVDNVYR